MFKILRKELLGPEMFLMEVFAPNVTRRVEPGQFIIVRVSETGERIPLSIGDFDRERQTVVIVFQRVGKTSYLLSTLNEGDSILDVVGPLGHPTEVDKFGTVVCVGGGIGIAPMYPIAKKLKREGNKVISIIGYRSKEHVFWEERLREASDELLLATNDGSYGKKGFVTDVLRELLEGGMKIDRVITIGPPVMMKAVADMTKPYSIKTIASLNSIMVCGLGMCGVCRVTVGGKTKFTCADGPDFDAHLVDFDEFMKRLSMYRDEEKLSFELWKKEVGV
ncbi:MAG: sulfide/dihydroorotate dehydrogenase-like FAD/NAD-binding protein [Brevinematia bacterium]